MVEAVHTAEVRDAASVDTPAPPKKTMFWLCEMIFSNFSTIFNTSFVSIDGNQCKILWILHFVFHISTVIFRKHLPQMYENILREHPVLAFLAGGRSAAAPWSQTAQAAASQADKPQASRADIIPASTSPLPPRARPGLPVGLTQTRPSGAATTVRAPFQHHHRIPLSGIPPGDALPVGLNGLHRKPRQPGHLPGWGVKISSLAGRGSSSPAFMRLAAALRPSASSTALPGKPVSSFFTSVRVSAARAVLWAR